MTVIATIFALLLLVTIILVIPFLIQAAACKKCRRQSECETLQKQGKLPPCASRFHQVMRNQNEI